jgi:hypothetical protein
MNPYLEKLQSLQFTPSSMPSRRDGAHCASANKADKELSKDLATFKTLREQGYNPKHIDGLTELEKHVESGLEIERGQSAAEIAMTTPSAQREDPSSMRDIHKGAPEFRRRMLEAHDHFSKQDPSKPGEMTV